MYQRISSRQLCLIGIIAGVMSSGCSQPGVMGNALAPTAPTALFSGASAASTDVVVIHAGPGDGYNATGLWDTWITMLNGDYVGSGVHAFTQDASGNIVGVGTEDPEDPEFDPGTYTFTRLGAGQGARISYRFTLTSPDPAGPACGRNLTGVAQLNVRTNTIEASRVTGTIDNCATVTLSFTFTKQ